MSRLRVAVPARVVLSTLVAVLVLSSASSSDSASAPLAVGATVVRSCVVGTGFVDQGSAVLEIRCTPTASSIVRLADAVEVRSKTSGTLSLRMPTAGFRGSQSTGDLRVVTVNF